MLITSRKSQRSSRHPTRPLREIRPIITRATQVRISAVRYGRSALAVSSAVDNSQSASVLATWTTRVSMPAPARYQSPMKLSSNPTIIISPISNKCAVEWLLVEFVQVIHCTPVIAPRCDPVGERVSVGNLLNADEFTPGRAGHATARDSRRSTGRCRRRVPRRRWRESAVRCRGACRQPVGFIGCSLYMMSMYTLKAGSQICSTLHNV